MTSDTRYPRKWLDRIPAEVFACLKAGELRLTVMPGVGLANGGSPCDVPIDKVPPNLRMPNTKLWIRMNDAWEIQEVWQRDDSELRLENVVHDVLIHDWDPIGCGVPDDEYDSYIPGICRLLRDGANEIKIGAHLEDIQTVSMGLRGNKDRNRQIAHILVERMRELTSVGQPKGGAAPDQSSANS
ncbi:MAG: hypothetical protein LLF97_05525 [Planctomycetaceae bacterium]|nr:hypothetical protein [Planctomycetaceae bacterium]